MQCGTLDGILELKEDITTTYVCIVSRSHRGRCRERSGELLFQKSQGGMSQK